MSLSSSPTIGERLCPKCGGTGQWVNPGYSADVRECFTCHGTGRVAPRDSVAPVSRGRNIGRPRRSTVVGDFLDLPSEATVEWLGDTPSAPTATASAADISTLASRVTEKIVPVIRQEIDTAVIRADRATRIHVDQKLHEAKTEVADEVFARLDRRAPRRIELTRQGVALPQVQGHQHPQFERLLRLATSRTGEGFVPNIWITGPAGSGKTTGAKMVAQALGVPFYVNGALETKFEATGYKDAAGHYHPTEFRRAFGAPSVYLFDDIDGCDSNGPVLALNSALANNLMAFPDATVDRHPDCIVIATANTWGLGATADYVGRIRFDAAFLDRFGGKLQWGYDEDFEAAICGNVEWAKRVQSARARAAANGLKVLISPRASIAGAAYLAAGFDPDEVAEMTYLAGLSAEQRRLLQ